MIYIEKERTDEDISCSNVIRNSITYSIFYKKSELSVGVVCWTRILSGSEDLGISLNFSA